jgi:cyclase
VLKKRLAGMVTVKDGWAVQSFGYGRYLPLGKPEVLVENLDRWGADEIILTCIDRGNTGPDLALLDRVSRKGLSTPLTYGGGIRHAEDAVSVVKMGADRVCVDALLHDQPATVPTLADHLGAQAVIASLPLSRGPQGLLWLDYRSRQSAPISREALDILQSGAVSEAIVVDWQNEGRPGGFDHALLLDFPVSEMPLIAFGGLSEPHQLSAALQLEQVVAVAIGNFLNYSEHSIHHYKTQLSGSPLRPSTFAARL